MQYRVSDVNRNPLVESMLTAHITEHNLLHVKTSV